MKTTSTMSNKSTLAIALAALAAGAALGVLLAPASGAETRKKLMRKGGELKDRLASMLEEGEELVAELKNKARGAMDSASDTASSVAGSARDAAQTVRDKVKQGAADVKDNLSEARTSMNAGRS